MARGQDRGVTGTGLLGRPGLHAKHGGGGRYGVEVRGLEGARLQEGRTAFDSMDYEMVPKSELLPQEEMQTMSLNGHSSTYLGFPPQILCWVESPLCQRSGDPDGQHIGNQHSTNNGAFLHNTCTQLPDQSCCGGESMGRHEEGLWGKFLVRESHWRPDFSCLIKALMTIGYCLAHLSFNLLYCMIFPSSQWDNCT